MVEERNHPVLAAGQFLLQPFALLGRRVVGLEGDELHVLLRRLERVVRLATHVERRVTRLLARVVIAERGLELHAGVEQRLVRDVELAAEGFRPFAAVDVVADGDDEQGREDRLHVCHLRGQLVLLLAAVAEIAEDEELERVGPVRQVEGGGCRGRLCLRRRCGRRNFRERGPREPGCTHRERGAQPPPDGGSKTT